MSPRLLAALAMLAAISSGCADESTCRDVATQPVARIAFGEPAPDREAVLEAFASRGWEILADEETEGAWVARAPLPGGLVAHARFLDAGEEAAPGLLVTTSAERATDVQAEQVLAPVVEPLEDALEEQTGQPVEAVYRAGATVCDGA